MVDRIAIVLIAFALVTLLGCGVQMSVRRRAAALTGTDVPVKLRALLGDAAPGIVYFYGPHCATCRQQARVLDAMRESGAAAIVRVDASVETGLADAYGVMTVPSTVVVDRQLRVRAVNVGFRSVDALQTQLVAVDADEDVESASA